MATQTHTRPARRLATEVRATDDVIDLAAWARAYAAAVVRVDAYRQAQGHAVALPEAS